MPPKPEAGFPFDPPAGAFAPPRGASSRPSVSRQSIAVVAAAWLIVAFVAVYLNSGAIAVQFGEMLATARNVTIAPEDPGNEPGAILCNDVDPVEGERLLASTRMMRSVGDGQRLYDLLLAHDVCITVRNLGHYAGMALPRPGLGGGWGYSTIQIDRDHLWTSGGNVVAATLIHEAVHLERAIGGVSCGDRDDCVILANNVALEEEVAAHAAEARWWIAAYGRAGKSSPNPEEAWQNELVRAYLAGAESFTAFVAAFRSEIPGP